MKNLKRFWIQKHIFDAKPVEPKITKFRWKLNLYKFSTEMISWTQIKMYIFTTEMTCILIIVVISDFNTFLQSEVLYWSLWYMLHYRQVHCWHSANIHISPKINCPYYALQKVRLRFTLFFFLRMKLLI